MKKPVLAPVLAALALILALLTYAAFWSAVAGAKAAVSRLSLQIQAQSVELVRLSSARDRLAALGSLSDTIDGYFVPESDVVSFINELQARGGAVGASVQIASVAAIPASGDAHTGLSIALAISGSFDEVLRALGSIEYAPHDLRVTQVTVAESSDKKTWIADATVLVGTTPNEAPAVAALNAATTSAIAATTTAPVRPAAATTSKPVSP